MSHARQGFMARAGPQNGQLPGLALKKRVPRDVQERIRVSRDLARVLFWPLLLENLQDSVAL